MNFAPESSYAYDAAGNRVSQLTDSASETYSYATGSHRLESITGSRTDSFSYDANGNTMAKDGAGFTYGAHNRLTEASLSGVPQVRYTYNGRGERVKKEASGITYYHYDPSGQLLAETDGQGDPLREYAYLEGMPLAVAAAQRAKADGYALQGHDPSSGQPFRLTLTPQIRTLSLEGLSGWDGTYRIAPERWRETSKGLLAAHTAPSGMGLKVKLVLTADSPTGTLTLTRPPRNGRYTLNETTGSGIYSGLEEKTGNTVRLTIDEDTRTLTLLEQDQPPRTLTIDPEHWQLKQIKRAKHLRFGAEAAGLTLKGALHLGKDGRVEGYLKLREGERQKSRYALTARPTPSGPAGLFYIHTDHLGIPQILTDETQQVVWTADYQPFGEATLTKENVIFNLRFPGQYFDSETGLHHNYFRDYDPTIGRYIESDPIGLGGGINTYAYVDNNPLYWVDPYGLAPYDPYPDADTAAKRAIRDINPSSIREDVEYAGRICRYADGNCFYTPPNRGSKARSYDGTCPKGMSPEGSYHTHGGYDPRYDSENFSDEDKGILDRDQTPGFLGTPSGTIKKYTPILGRPLRGRVTPIGTGAK